MALIAKITAILQISIIYLRTQQGNILKTFHHERYLNVLSCFVWNNLWKSTRLDNCVIHGRVVSLLYK